MIKIGTNVRISDNSGAISGVCIGLSDDRATYRGVHTGACSPGDVILLSVKKIRSFKKVKKGELYKAVIIRSKKGVTRLSGEQVSCGDNAVVLLNNKRLPVGTRVKGPVMLELRDRGFDRVISISGVTV